MDAIACMLLFWTIPNPHPPDIELMDASRFNVTRQQACTLRELNRKCYTHAEGEWMLCPARQRYWERVMEDLRWRYKIWDLLADSIEPEPGTDTMFYSEENRLGWLLELRETIGLNAYYEGRIPEAVPIWYFRIMP